MKKCMFLSVLLLPLLLVPMAGHANHGIHAPGYVPSTPLNTVYTMGRFAQFEVGDERGTWSAIEFGGEYAPLDFLSLTAVVPLYRVVPEGGETTSGFGDITAGVRWQAFRSEDSDFLLLFGLATELPAGSQANRTGSGHFELIPHFEFSVRLAKSLMLTTSALYGFSLDSGHSHHDHDNESSTPHGSLISPHSEQEVEARLSLLYMADQGFLQGNLGAKYGIQHPNELGPVDLSMRAGLNVGHGAMVVLGFSHTIAGAVRAPWQAQIGFAWLIGEHTHPISKPGDCQCGPVEKVAPCQCAPEPETIEPGCGCGSP